MVEDKETKEKQKQGEQKEEEERIIQKKGLNEKKANQAARGKSGQEEYSYQLKIPKSRIAVLIGKKGEIKKTIEVTTGIKIQVDSKEGEVILFGSDSLKLFTVKEIIKAIARGFNPEVALFLLKPDYYLEIIRISDYANTKKEEIRLKGRVIGQKGKSRRTLEEMTDSFICVFGKTISVIGQVEEVYLTKQAIEKLLQGSPHTNVYAWLKKELAKAHFPEKELIKKKNDQQSKEGVKGSRRNRKSKNNEE